MNHRIAWQQSISYQMKNNIGHSINLLSVTIFHTSSGDCHVELIFIFLKCFDDLTSWGKFTFVAKTRTDFFSELITGFCSWLTLTCSLKIHVGHYYRPYYRPLFPLLIQNPTLSYACILAADKLQQPPYNSHLENWIPGACNNNVFFLTTLTQAIRLRRWKFRTRSATL